MPEPLEFGKTEADVRWWSGFGLDELIVVDPWGLITPGSAAAAHEAAVSTNRPVVTAAAGRSQPNQPARLGSGLNLSTTAPTTAGSQSRAGTKLRHHDP